MKKTAKSLTLHKETLTLLDHTEVNVADGARTGTVCTRLSCVSILLSNTCCH
mgnify:CR=1 FL=1